MNIANLKDVDSRTSLNGAKTSLLYNMTRAQAKHLILEPEEFMQKHAAPVDVVFYVIEGKGVVEIGDEKQDVGPDTLVDCPAMLPHCWYNNSGKSLRVLAVKVPASRRNHCLHENNPNGGTHNT